MTGCAGAAQATGVTPELRGKAQVQGTVLVAEIASTGHRVVRELASLPQMALEGSDDTLRFDRIVRPGLHRLVGAAALVLSVAGCAAAASPVPGLTPELLGEARDRGTVRVLVQFQVPEGAGAAEIEAVKRAVLAELVGTRHRVVRELHGLPVMALEASEDALRALSASPHGLRIEEDRLLRPLR